MPGLTWPEAAFVAWMRASSYWALGQAVIHDLQNPDLRRIRADIGLPFGPGSAHRADVFYPPAEALGAVLFVHGGGWAGGTRRFGEPLGRELASRGFLTIMPGYRLLPQANVEEATSDVRRAWEWALGFADREGFSPARVALGGESAGSHLTTRALLRHFAPEGIAPPAHIAVFGPHDMENFLARAQPITRAAMRLLRHPYGSLREAAPLLSNVTVPWPRHVRLLTIHGDRDPLVPYRMSVRLHAHAQKSGARAEHVRIHGAPHGFINTPRTRHGKPAVEAMDRWLRGIWQDQG